MNRVMRDRGAIIPPSYGDMSIVERRFSVLEVQPEIIPCEHAAALLSAQTSCITSRNTLS